MVNIRSYNSLKFPPIFIKFDRILIYDRDTNYFPRKLLINCILKLYYKIYIVYSKKHSHPLSSRIKKSYRKRALKQLILKRRERSRSVQSPKNSNTADPFAKDRRQRSRVRVSAEIRTDPECISIPGTGFDTRGIALGRTLITPTPGTMPAPGRN